MDTKERYGRFVLQAEDARTSAGSFFRAVQLGSSGYERHVVLFRSEPLSPVALQAVADGLKNGSLIQHAQIARCFETGRLDQTAFAASEILEGRSVGALMERSKGEGHPFAADHALLIASKAAAALEAAQARKQAHGFLIPECVQVSHDGEVSVRAFGLPARVLRDANRVGAREARFLAPEVETSGPFDIRADVFSLGAQLFEMLTGAPLRRDQATSKSIQAARIPSPGSDGTPVPKVLASLLAQALAEDPAARFTDATAFKKAVDTLLFSGDYSPTTFNLAFFMHTLFRDEGDEDTVRLKAERTAAYPPYPGPAAGDVVNVTTGSAVASPPPAPAPAPAPPPAPPPAPAPALSASGLPLAALAPPDHEAGFRTEPIRRESPRSDAVRHDSGRIARVQALPAQSAPEDQVFKTAMAEKKAFPVAPLAIGIAAALAIAGFFLTRSGPTPKAPVASPTMNAAESAALARVRELESRLGAMEAEKAAAAQKAAEDAKKAIEAQARARGRAVDPAELQKAQDEARKKSQAEQEARVAAERQQIEEERKRAEETRAAEAAKAASAAPAPSAPAPPTPTLTPSASPVLAAAPSSTGSPSAATGGASVPAPVPAPPAGAGGSDPLDLSDPGVVAPQLISQPRVDYPPMARAQRITGTVLISALVDEQGNVAETRVIRSPSASNSGLTEAALASVKRRKYKPATQNGKPGRAWIAIQIDFRL